MKYADAKDFIRATFVDPLQANELARSISDETYIEVLSAIERYLPFDHGRIVQSCRLFLYAGCLKFDRWVVPTPYVLNPENRRAFNRFVMALSRFEKDSTNTARFLADAVKWDLFDLLDRKPLTDQEILRGLPLLDSRLDGIPSPTQPQKVVEFSQVITECYALIKAAMKGAIRTTIRTKIPIRPFVSPVAAKMQWRGIPITVSLTPFSLTPEGIPISTDADNVAIPLSPSQWQVGYCDIQIDFEALVDSALFAVPLIAIRTHISPPYNGWPKIFVDIFEILDAVIWKLRQEEHLQGKWILSPGDIGNVEWELWAEETKVGFIMKGPPGIVMISGEKPEKQVITLDILEPIEWHIRCRLLAENYLASGATNEALFWVNVGAEALFEARSRGICASSGIDYETLSSGASYWDRAEKVLSQQFPEMAAKVKWPTAAQGVPSWFTRINYLSGKVPLRQSTDEILKHYKKINDYRTALFHGLHEDRASVEVVVDALNASIWLEENFAAASV